MRGKIETEGRGATPRRFRQIMERIKKTTPKEWIAIRKWREFLGAIPADGKTHSYIVQSPNDVMTIRVTAAQIKTDERWYRVETDLLKRKVKILVNPTKEKEDCV